MLNQIQYVGTLNHILQLSYGPMSSQIVLFRCNWVKNRTNNRGNPIYKQNEFDGPFVFLHKFNMCFFGVNQRHLGGKLYLGGSLKVNRLLQTRMMTALRCTMLCMG